MYPMPIRQLLNTLRNEFVVSAILALFLGFFLNYTVYFSRAQNQLLLSGDYGSVYLVAEIFANILFSFFLFRLIAQTGLLSFKILTSFIILISIAVSYYVMFYDVIIGYGILVSTLATDSVELSQEAVGGHFYLWFSLLSVPALLLIWSAKKTRIQTASRRRALALFTFIVIPVLIFGYLKLADANQKKIEMNGSIDVSSYGGELSYSYLPTNWIVPLVQYAVVKYDDAFNEIDLFDPADEFTYTPAPQNDDLYVVFVIGETARWDHMQLLGYERETTPLLSADKNVIAFKGQSCDTSTKLSLRCMFVREGGVKDNEQRTVTENNVFSVMKQNGFYSELFSMQSEVWFYNRLDLDNYLIREMITAQNRTPGKAIRDELLMDEVDDMLARKKQGQNLIILHTKGSHHLYSKRYPPEFRKYMPECTEEGTKCSTQEEINAYDNSILYTDHFLHDLTEKLKDKNAIVFYTSDHGESLGENNGMRLHGTPRHIAPPEQFRVPFIVWMSDNYIKNNPSLFDNLKENSRTRTFFHHELFDTILGCSGVTSSDGGINNKNNLCYR
ncbi:TPA: kdo(2)-lipid A phosphoethanolamine 7''-transferase [Morganella morganii]|nr:kdo(2)-lipid A phosphoethanolamine 7''-transferase [Morganella morganii]